MTRHLRVRIVDSLSDPGLLSLRLMQKPKPGHTGGTALKQAIVRSGFKAGEPAVLVSWEEWRKLRAAAGDAP